MALSSGVFIILYANDIERLTTFYRDVIGLRCEYSLPGRVQFNANGAALVLHQTNSQRGPRRGSDLAHIGLKVDDLEGEYERLIGRQVKFKSPPARAEFGKLAICIDPEGNEIDLTEWEQGTRHPVSGDTRVNDIISEHPETMEVFENHGIRICGGCLVLLNSPVFETAEYSGLDANETSALVGELNRKLAEFESSRT